MKIFDVAIHYKASLKLPVYKVTGIESTNGSEARLIARRQALIEVGPMVPKKLVVNLVANKSGDNHLIDEFV